MATDSTISWDLLEVHLFRHVLNETLNFESSTSHAGVSKPRR